MTRASACGSSWLSVESRRVALATIATPSRADAPRRRPVAAVRHATAAEAPATHWAGRQKARAALASATRLMSESDRASFAAYDVEFVVEISRCRAPLHRSTTQALRHAADVELYSSTALQRSRALYISTALQRSTLYILYTLPQVLWPCERAPSLLQGQGSLSRSPSPSIRPAGCASELTTGTGCEATDCTPSAPRSSVGTRFLCLFILEMLASAIGNRDAAQPEHGAGPHPCPWAWLPGRGGKSRKRGVRWG